MNSRFSPKVCSTLGWEAIVFEEDRQGFIGPERANATNLKMASQRQFTNPADFRQAQRQGYVPIAVVPQYLPAPLPGTRLPHSMRMITKYTDSRRLL